MASFQKTFAAKCAKLPLLLLILTFITQALFSNTVTFKMNNYTGFITYNEEVLVGDAICARLTLAQDKNKKKVTPEVVASIQLLREDKKIDNSRFYPIKSQKPTEVKMLTLLPTSLWANPQNSYGLKVLLTLNGSSKEVTLPLAIIEKKFFSETLDLNEANSKIKQDMTAERAAQIKKLNKVLGTINPSNVFSLKPFIRPVKSERMTAHFGDKRIYKYTNGKSESSSHYGNDYGVPEHTDVFACAEGKVVMAENRVSTGWSVVIEHLPGLYSLYYHMSELSVKEGDSVRQGSKIGYSGSTGLATGPHLHWEVRLNMAAVTPEFFMKDFTYENGEE